MYISGWTGSDGTGKTWLAELIAIEACRKGKRVRWVQFPCMYRELETLKQTNSPKFETRLTYYSKFDLLCIDEFLNYSLDDPFLMQELFDRIKVFSVSGIGESSRGRVLEHCKNIHLQGSDLRMKGIS